MPKTAISAAATAAFLLSACGSPDPWPGRYRGVAMAEGRDCTTGERVTGDDQVTTVIVERDSSGGLFISGLCLLPLVELSERSARFSPVECETSLDDGTPVRLHVVNGRAELDGDELSLEYAIDASGPDGCLTISSVFVGGRE